MGLSSTPSPYGGWILTVQIYFNLFKMKNIFFGKARAIFYHHFNLFLCLGLIRRKDLVVQAWPQVKTIFKACVQGDHYWTQQWQKMPSWYPIFTTLKVLLYTTTVWIYNQFSCVLWSFFVVKFWVYWYFTLEPLCILCCSNVNNYVVFF